MTTGIDARPPARSGRHRVPYAYAAVTDPGRMVFTAGACPLDADGTVVAVGDVAGPGPAGHGQPRHRRWRRRVRRCRRPQDHRLRRVHRPRRPRRGLAGRARAPSATTTPRARWSGVALLGYPDQLVEVEAGRRARHRGASRTRRRTGLYRGRVSPRRFFYDTEFIEDGTTIDLVSIGVVDETGREFYAVSTQFDPRQGDPVGAAQRARPAAARRPTRPGAAASGSARTCSPSSPARARRSSCGPGSAPTTTSRCASCGARCRRCRGRSRGSPASCASAGTTSASRDLPPKPTGTHDALVDARYNLARWQVMEARADDRRPDRRPPRRSASGRLLRAYLDFHRETLALKCAGLSDDDLRRPGRRRRRCRCSDWSGTWPRSSARWFRRVLDGQDVPLVWSAGRRLPGRLRRRRRDAGGGVRGLAGRDRDRPAHRGRGAVARRHRVDRRYGDVYSLRRVLLHVIQEYARHNGHADLIREGIDGVTGV